MTAHPLGDLWKFSRLLYLMQVYMGCKWSAPEDRYHFYVAKRPLFGPRSGDETLPVKCLTNHRAEMESCIPKDQ